MNEKGNVLPFRAETVPMKWALEYKGVRMSQEFDSATEAAAHAKSRWPDTPEATLGDNDADDKSGWLVVPVQPD